MAIRHFLNLACFRLWNLSEIVLMQGDGAIHTVTFNSCGSSSINASCDYRYSYL